MSNGCGKLTQMEFRSYHAEMLHDNNEDIQKLIERVQYLEEYYERGTVSRQLVTLCVTSIWFALISGGLLVLRGILSGN